MFGLFSDPPPLLTASGRIARIGVLANMDSPTHFLVAIEGYDGVFALKAEYKPNALEGILELSKPGDLLTVTYVEGKSTHQGRSYTNHSIAADAAQKWLPGSVAEAQPLSEAQSGLSLRDEMSYRTHQRMTEENPERVVVVPLSQVVVPHILVAGPSGQPKPPSVTVDQADAPSN